MPNRQIIDIHCHLFNAKYAIMELAAATWNHLLGHYPHQKGAAKKRAARGIIETLEGAKDFAAWIARLLEVSLSDCEGNFLTARKNFAESELGKNASLIITPLMMDIYFALCDNRDEETAGRRGRRALITVEPFSIPEDGKKNFEDHFDHIKNLILEEIQKTPATRRRSASGETLNTLFDDARKDLLAVPKKTRRSVNPYEGIELSPGFKQHMHDLEALAKKYPGQVFPFLAVDPRRIGILKLMDLKVKKGKGIFKGIKLYTPLGYLPTHPNLAPVFEYCTTYDIPITLHCSQGGMNNFRKENYVNTWEGSNHWEDFKTVQGNKSSYFTAPEKWRPVLNRWPNLRINFAHFGGGDQLAEGHTAWMEEIIKMIQEHPHVYTDISYHAQSKLPRKILNIVTQNKGLESKLMFGTDYIMIMMVNKLGGLKKYFDHFTAFQDNLLCDNAKTFLKI
ncbi:MAG: amidohydrolase family protein [Proteobacteria bacterium]|nr:amidohydrolase family protein [Pseudomonadota bacterium]MBU4053549.1 amidohydrolase family protein [Pseudomonadota bacterium]